MFCHRIECDICQSEMSGLLRIERGLNSLRSDLSACVTRQWKSSQFFQNEAIDVFLTNNILSCWLVRSIEVACGHNSNILKQFKILALGFLSVPKCS